MSQKKIRLNTPHFSKTKIASASGISSSLEYLTMNASHTFGYFSKDVRNELTARQSLTALLKDLSCRTWLEIAQLGRKSQCGFETIPAVQLKFAPSKYDFSRDEKAWVFRFGRQRYRLIGIQNDGVLYIIGYDFDFSAYSH